MNLYPYQQELVKKIREAYLQGYKAPCVVSPCGSGKSIVIAEIAKMTAEKGNRVLFLVHRKELVDQIKGTFKKAGIDPYLSQVGMVQTISRRLGKIKTPGLIITDENHHALANTYRKIYDFYEDVPRLGFTATPIRLNGAGLKDVNDLLIMGPEVAWLVDNNYLSPYKYYAPPTVDLSGLKKARGEFTNKSIDASMHKKVIYGDVIGHYKRLADGEQAICYCHSVDASKRAAMAFNDADIPAMHLDANTPKAERDKIIQDFRDKKTLILCNVDLIGEGFDVPDCSTVIMLRPTMSLSLYIQQSMRGMRYRPGKVSKIIDHVGNVERHGFPDMKRAWSLEGRPKKSKSYERDESIPRICMNCFAAVDRKYKICPICGEPFKVEPKKITVTSGELKEIKNDFNFTVSYKEPSDCKSMAELYALAKERGYKRGWAYYQGKNLGFI